MRRVLWLALFAGLLFPAAYAQEQPGGALKSAAAQEDSHLLWKWANFGLLAGILAYAAVKKGPAFFNARTAQIQKAIEDATGLRLDAEFRASEMDRKLATLEAEVAKLRAAAHIELQVESDRIERETAAALEGVRAHTTREIERLEHQARIQLRAHAVQLAIAISRARLRNELTPAEREGLVHFFASSVAQGAT